MHVFCFVNNELKKKNYEELYIYYGQMRLPGLDEVREDSKIHKFV
jgi:hypothetical protein